MPVDPNMFRHIVGHYPTGVCVISTMSDEGVPIGMAVGTFTSVSLDPPLVAFLPSKASRSWSAIERARQFCVSVLADDQEWLCARFASKLENKFQDVSHRLSEAGLPVLDEALAWIDCSLHAVHEAGDHLIVLGEVRALAIARQTGPLIFYRGGYGTFAPRDAAFC